MWIVTICLSVAVLYLGTMLYHTAQHTRMLEAKLHSATATIQTLSSQRCSKQLPITQQANTTYTATHQGREYRIHLPAEFERDQRYPLVVAFDGMDGSAAHIEGYSGLDNLQAIIVYPEQTLGTNGLTAWQGAPYSSQVNDIAFVRELIREIIHGYCIMPDKVFAVGMSNGGAFARLAACELSDIIAASASIAGAYYKECTGGGPTLIIHSKDDRQIPYLGHVSRRLPEVRKVAENIATAQGCSRRPSEVRVYTQHTDMTWHCPQLVRLVVVNHYPHGWIPHIDTIPQYGTTQVVDILWRFFLESS